MVKRSIGIEYNSGSIEAVQMSRTGQAYCIEKVATVSDLSEDQTPTSLYQSLIDTHGFDHRAGVALAIASSDVYYTRDASSTIDNFPIAQDRALIDEYSGDKHGDSKKQILKAAVDSNSINQQLEDIASAKLRCELVDSSLFAVITAIRYHYPESFTVPSLVLHGDSSHIIMAIVEQNNILLARNITIGEYLDIGISLNDDAYEMLKAEIDISWHLACSCEMPSETPLYLSGVLSENHQVVHDLAEKTDCSIMALDYMTDKLGSKTDQSAKPSGIAQGMALRALSPGSYAGMNFMAVLEKVQAKPTEVRHQLITLIGLLVGTLVLLLGNVFVQKSQQENMNALLNTQIRNVYAQIAPNDTNIVDELAQAQDHLGSLKSQYATLKYYQMNTTTPLTMLNVVSSYTPPSLEITLNSIVINDQAITIEAEAADSNKPYEWQDVLNKSKQFSSVRISNLTRDVLTHKASFTVTMTLDQEGD